MKISGLELSKAGDKYLGRSYQEMDCQAFVEKCMADVGCRRDLGGSNSWYRECMKHGWVGSPEECAKEFGSVPKGALLFILEAVGPKTPAKFRNDGIGDVTHMGIVTGRGDGAIHSSQSRGGVVKSKFKGKTIPNGGWNRVGLLEEFEYGEESRGGTSGTVFLVQHSSNEKGRPLVPQHSSNEKGRPLVSTGEMEGLDFEEETMTGIVTAETGRTVNLRKKKGGKLIERIPIGTEVEILDYGPEWCRVKAGRYTGWMMTEFIRGFSGRDEPLEPLRGKYFLRRILNRMNWETIVVAVITAGFAYLGVYSSNRKQAALVAYRLEKLEEKVGKHNNLVERMYKLESRLEALEGKRS